MLGYIGVSVFFLYMAFGAFLCLYLIVKLILIIIKYRRDKSEITINNKLQTDISSNEDKKSNDINLSYNERIEISKKGNSRIVSNFNWKNLKPYFSQKKWIEYVVEEWPEYKKGNATLNIFSMYPYFPKNMDSRGFVPTEDEQKTRQMIYDFKDGRSGDIVVNNLIEIIAFAFRYYSRYLTFVCIPASSQYNNERRYKLFSDEICEATGMINSYNYIEINSDGEAKHLGGSKKASVTYDRDFFNNKNVILFDDVITKGNTIFEVKHKLEKLGATVICAITIGKTVHQRFIPKNWYDQEISMDNVFNNNGLINFLGIDDELVDCALPDILIEKINNSKVLYDIKNIVNKYSSVKQFLAEKRLDDILNCMGYDFRHYLSILINLERDACNNIYFGHVEKLERVDLTLSDVDKYLEEYLSMYYFLNVFKMYIKCLSEENIIKENESESSESLNCMIEIRTYMFNSNLLSDKANELVADLEGELKNGGLNKGVESRVTFARAICEKYLNNEDSENLVDNEISYNEEPTAKELNALSDDEFTEFLETGRLPKRNI